MSASRASDMLIAIWSFCEPEDREAFVSYLAIGGYLERASSAVEVGAPVSPEGATSFSSLNSFSGIGSARETSAMLHPGVVDGPTASLAGRDSGDGVERHATNSQSDDDAFSEVKGAARPENAAGVEPSSSDNPSTAPTVEPEATPSPPPASGTHSNPQPVSLTTADKAEASTSSPSASAAPFAVMSKADQIRLIRPYCQHLDDLDKCGGSGRNHCPACKKAMAEGEAAA